MGVIIDVLPASDDTSLLERPEPRCYVVRELLGKWPLTKCSQGSTSTFLPAGTVADARNVCHLSFETPLLWLITWISCGLYYQLPQASIPVLWLILKPTFASGRVRQVSVPVLAMCLYRTGTDPGRLRSPYWQFNVPHPGITALLYHGTVLYISIFTACLPQSLRVVSNLVPLPPRSRQPRRSSLLVLAPLVFLQLFIFSRVVTQM